MHDPEKIVLDYLRSVPALAVLAGDRLYAGRDWPPDYRPADGGAVLLAVRGGGTLDPLLHPSVQLLCCGPSAAQARAVAFAAHDALHNRAGSGIKQARCEALPQEVGNGAGWPVYLSAYRFWLT